MSLYGTQNLATSTIDEEAELLELFLYDDLHRCNEEQIKEFCESDECKALVEAKAFRKPMVIRLSKEADSTRRTKLAAYRLAKEANDPLWDKFKLMTAKRKEIIAKIMKKYGNKGGKQAVKAQKAYIKLSSKLPAKASDNLR